MWERKILPNKIDCFYEYKGKALTFHYEYIESMQYASGILCFKLNKVDWEYNLKTQEEAKQKCYDIAREFIDQEKDPEFKKQMQYDLSKLI